jgi:hypothetical protein
MLGRRRAWSSTSRSLELLETFFPWEAERNRGVELTDANGILAGRLVPTVRKPIGELPSGALVLGMADVVVLNDPITGQGSNNASRCAAVYLDEILKRGSEPFDAGWMGVTFERYWDYARFVTGWTNALLGPPPEHVLEDLRRRRPEPEDRQAVRRGVRRSARLLRVVHDPDKAGHTSPGWRRRTERRGALGARYPARALYMTRGDHRAAGR